MVDFCGYLWNMVEQGPNKLNLLSLFNDSRNNTAQIPGD